MISDYNDQTKIIKVHTATTKGYKPGSTNATWKKIKQATNTSEEGNVFDPNQVECGPQGELFVLYPMAQVVEIWYWLPPEYGDMSKDFSGDTLYLYAQVEIGATSSIDDIGFVGDAIDYIRIIDGSLTTGYTILVAHGKSTLATSRLEIHKVSTRATSSTLEQALPLPDYMLDTDKYTVKFNDKFIMAATDKGFIYPFRKESDKYIPANLGDALKNLKKNSSLPVLRKHGLVSKLEENEILLQTSCVNGTPIFDINDDWLVYSPKKAEYNQINIDNENDRLFTPVKLPNSKPLLNKVLESLSNTALDLLFRLSKYSTNKLNQYMTKKDDKDITMKSIKGSLNKMLHSTISTINETAKPFTINDNQLVKIIDLSNDKVLSIFKAPDGVSNLSLSPYDLQLVNANSRGDSFFMWDLLKLPNEVSLIGKFSRGKTSGLVNDVFWFINHNGDGKEITKGTNSGFGCINEKTGSVHWFNINYLLGNLNNNLPNYLGKDFPVSSSDKDFLNSWIISSSSKYRRFLKLPSLSGSADKSVAQLHQLAVLDDKNTLLLLSPLNGSNSYKFEIPTKRTDPQLLKRSAQVPAVKKTEDSKAEVIPVSQIEIETSKPFMNFINYKGVELSTYNFEDSKCDFDSLRQFYSDFNRDQIPSKKINVASDTNIESSDTLNEVFDNLLIAQ